MHNMNYFADLEHQTAKKKENKGAQKLDMSFFILKICVFKSEKRR